MSTTNISLDMISTPAKPALLSLPPEGLKAWIAEKQQPAHRLVQIKQWLLLKRCMSFSDMSDLPKSLRDDLASAFALYSEEIEIHKIAEDDTRKLILKLQDGNRIECVLMKEESRRTVCVSTQVGCAMGCVFCASGIDGVVRNLKSYEILEQMILARNLLPESERLSHVVIMGMGEPMANLDNLLEALEIACSPNGLGLSARHITISTVGLPIKIKQLADTGKQYHLAVSLHAPNDEIRSKIVPTNAKIGIHEVLDAADYFQEVTGRQVTFEYILLGGINDQDDHAHELAGLLRKRKAHVNLIPFNRVQGLPFAKPEQEAVHEFVRILKASGQTVTVRKRKGADIDAACGQLRRASGQRLKTD